MRESERERERETARERERERENARARRQPRLLNPCQPKAGQEDTSKAMSDNPGFTPDTALNRPLPGATARNTYV